eukprot:maker-scaffold912_size81766-snap-gene-0.18 protein:Tk07075 transcript:maker-scaffold912_size81766-snap-gene-0.18-mRNA-1 annotation:"conserved hypothetical protein"
MRLTQILLKFPKVPPNGNIWIGRNKMVRKVLPKHMEEMVHNIDREKRNIAILLNPCVNKEREAQLVADLEQDTGTADKLWFKMRQIKVEGTSMAPVPLSEHFKCLNQEHKW